MASLCHAQITEGSALPGVAGVQDRGLARGLKQDHSGAWTVVGLQKCDPDAVHHSRGVEIVHHQPVQWQLQPQMDQAGCDCGAVHESCTVYFRKWTVLPGQQIRNLPRLSLV